MRIALFLICLSAGIVHAEVPTIPFALSGEPAPGAPDRTFLGFGPPAIHDSGQIIFGGYLDPSDPDNDLGLWVGTPGDIRLAVREGDIAPGTGGRLFEGFAPYDNGTRLTPYHPQMNGVGEITFRGALKGDEPREGGGIWAGSPGSLALIALVGEPAPGLPGRTFRVFNQPYIDEAGNVLFGAGLDDYTQSLWHSGPNGLTVLMARGLPAPGLPLHSYYHMSDRNYSLDPQGHVLFTAEVSDSVGNRMKGVWTGAPDNLELLVVQGDTAPELGVPFTDVFGIQSRSDGAALVVGAIQSNHTEGLWIGVPGNLTLVPEVRRGDPAPGTGLAFRSIGSPSMNESGRVVFYGPLEASIYEDSAIWTNANGNLELIAREGDVAPGTDGEIFRRSIPSSNPFLIPSIGTDGAVVFEADVFGGEGLWVWRDGVLESVVTTSLPYDVTDCDSRNVHVATFNPWGGSYGAGGIYGQNAAGQIAFHVGFQDLDTLELSFGLFVTGDDDSCGGAAPDCSGAAPSVAELWPPNHKMQSIEIVGVTDPNGGSPALKVLAVNSDETAIGPGAHHDPDARIDGDGSVALRAERFGGGNGRVYEILFQASNDDGVCEGAVQVSVPHDQSGSPAVNDGQTHDATSGG